MDSNSSSNIIELPDEILLKIFRHLPTNEIIRNILDVCERFRSVVVNYIPFNLRINGSLKLNWNNPQYKWMLEEYSVNVWRKVATLGVKVNVLYLKDFGINRESRYRQNPKSGPIDPALDVFCSNNLPISELTLETVTVNEKIGLFDVLDNLKLLQTLGLYSYSSIVTSVSENYIRSKQPNYVKLSNVRICYHEVKDYENENKWLVELINRCPSLQNFDVRTCRGTFELFQELSKRHSLETLVLRDMTVKDVNALRPLQNNSTVQKFTLKAVVCYVGLTLQVLRLDLTPISTMTSLKELNIRLSITSTTEMERFLSSLPLSIENFYIHVTHMEMKDEQLDLISKRLPNLKKLKLRIRNQDFSDNGMQMFIQNMKELEWLRLKLEVFEWSSLLDSNSWMAELLNHPKLKEASLCFQDDDRCVPVLYQHMIKKAHPLVRSVFEVIDVYNDPVVYTYILLKWDRNNL